MLPRHTLRTLCLALAGAGLLLPALAQDTGSAAADARRALGLDPAAPASAPLPVWALGLQPDAGARAVALPAAPRPTARDALALGLDAEPAAAEVQAASEHVAHAHDAPARALPAALDEPAPTAAELAPAELARALPAAALPPLAPVPDAPVPEPSGLRDAPLLAETRMTAVPLLAAVPFIDTPPGGDGEPEGGLDVAWADEPGEAAARPALAEPVPAQAAPASVAAAHDAARDEPADAAPLPGHVPATAQAVAPAGEVAFAALDDTRVLAAAEPVARLDAPSAQVERVLATLAEVTGLHDVQPLLHEPLVAMAPLSAVDRVLADLADVTQRWQLAQEAWLDDQRPNAMGEGWQRVARAELDGTRGGFVAPNGLRISFGIERAVYINGNLVATTRLTVSELGAISGTGASPNGAPGLALIQNGALGTVTGTIAPGAVGTVIQNALNGQQIQNTTVINATVNSLDVMRSMNLQSTIRNAVSDSLRR